MPQTSSSSIHDSSIASNDTAAEKRPDNTTNVTTKSNSTTPRLPQNHAIQWLKCLELSYETTTTTDDDNDTSTATKPCFEIPSGGCFHCGETSKQPLSTCSKCKVAKYCSRECQVQDWKSTPTSSKTTTTAALPLVAHKYLCKALQYCGGNTSLTLTTSEQKEIARDVLWSSIRFYTCPYSIHHSQTLGRGFCFLQSPFTLSQINLSRQVFHAYPNNNNSSNDNLEQQQQPRNVLVHFLTLGEYDQEICRDDFELASVRDELTQAVNKYDRERELVVLMRFRCGHLALGKVTNLVPEYGVCKSLGRDYYGGDGNKSVQALQLNLDDL